MAPLCYRRHCFPPEIIQHAIWLYLWTVPARQGALVAGQSIGLQLSIRPLMQLALLASMRSADRRPITLAGICSPIEPTGLGDPGPTGCHHNFVRPRTPETEAWR
jgi:hypothetical protein